MALPLSRRRLLLALTGALLGAPLFYYRRRGRSLRPAELAPIPWIGHC